MNRRTKMKPLGFAVIFIAAFSAALLAQNPVPVPTARPLPPEVIKRRDAGKAFELGRLYLRQGKANSLRLANENFTIAERHFLELRDQANAAAARIGVAAVEEMSGDLTSAAISYELSLGRLRNTNDPDEKALVRLGFLYDHLVGKRLLFKYDELAVKRPRPGYDLDGNKLDPRFSHTDESVYVQIFNQPFTVRIESDRWRDVPDPRLAGSDREPEGERFYKDVLSIWHLNGTRSFEIATDISLMDAWAGSNAEMAVFYGKRAINKYQELRRELKQRKPYDPRYYYNQLAAKYRSLADLLIGLGRFSEADDVLQMLKEEEFSDFVKRDATEIERLKLRVRLTDKERQLINRYLRFAERATAIGEQFRVLEQKKLTAAAQGKALSAADENTYRQTAAQIADINAAFELFLKKELVMEIGTGNAKLLAGDRDLQNSVREWGEGTVALYTVITEDRYRVVLTTPTVQIDGKTDISAALLNKKIFAFHRALQDTKVDPRPIGKELYDILIKPIEKDLAAAGAKTLVWSLDGMLRYIPIAALSPDGSTYLAERYQTVTITPRTRSRFSGENLAWKALGMGVSTEQNVTFPDGRRVKMDALPGTRDELVAIVRDEDVPAETGILVGKRYLDDEFSLSNLTSSLDRTDSKGKRYFTVVHFASHFRLGADWTNSALLLGNGKFLSLEQINNDRAITFDDVELVTLSACNTALTTSSNGIEIDSLAEAIQAKNGRAVLATLWSVYDESTSQLMTDFYSMKRSNPRLTKAEALQRAQLRMIKGNDFAHPYYWSGFTLIGNWR